MKTFVTIVAVALFSTGIWAQDLQLVGAKTDYTLSGLSTSWSEPWFLFYLDVQNSGLNTVTCKVRVDKTDLAPGHRVKFCFGPDCYEESVLVSPNPSVINAGMTDTTFVGDFKADSNFASSTAYFTFFDATNQLQSVLAEIHFKVEDPAAAVQDAELSSHMIAAPNPATELLNISLPNPTHERRTLRIIDTQGKTIQSLQFFADELRFNTSNVANGSYMAIIESAEGHVAAKSFVVLH